MNSRRNFISKSLQLGAATGMASIFPGFGYHKNETMKSNIKWDKVTLPANFGLGGVAIGNGFRPTTDEQAQLALEGAWAAGVRFFDTSLVWPGIE